MAICIPPETLDHILSFARGSPPLWTQASDDYTVPAAPEVKHPNATLLSVSLVNKQWQSSAQRALYRHAIFPNKSTEHTYTAWIESDARRRHRTKSLWIRMCHAPVFGRILRSMEDIEELDIARTWGIEAHPSWDNLRLPSLKNLQRISITFPAKFRASVLHFAPIQFSLSTLEYGLCFQIPGPQQQIELFGALIVASESTLHTLRIRREGKPPRLNRSVLLSIILPLRLVAPRIVHLTLEEPDYQPTFLNTDYLSKFSALEILSLGDCMPETRSWEFSDECFGSTIATLPHPNSLRHLVLGITDGYHLDFVSEKLSNSSLEGLETLEFPYLKRSEVSAADGAQLVRACRQRSIALMFEDHPAGRDEDDLIDRWTTCFE
ncbi:hypothetical protein RQP46_008585 [Phenoliferia psychrophenolica]